MKYLFSGPTRVPLAGTAEHQCLGITGPESSLGDEIYRKGKEKVPCLMVLGEFQRECLAFFIEWSFNFPKFIFSSPLISFEGLRGRVGKHGKGSQLFGSWAGWGLSGARPSLCLLGVVGGWSQNGGEKNWD